MALLTPRGKALLAQCKRAAKHVEDALLQSLTPAQEHRGRQWLVSAAREAADERS
jgi:DNA-binding MarR family transcriptional regulator